MAVRGRKRASVAKDGETSAKRKCLGIAKAVRAAQDCPGHLIGDMALIALSVYKSDRDEFQVKVVDEVAGALKKLHESKQASIASTELEVQGAVNDKNVRRKNVADAEAKLQELEESIRGAQQTLKDATQEESDAKAAAADAKKAQRAGDKGLDASEAEQQELTSAIDTINAGSAKPSSVKNVLQLCKRSGLDALMLNALASVLKESKDARSSFATATVGQCVSTLLEKLAACNKALEEGAPAKAERAAAVEAAQSAFLAKKTAREEAANSLNALSAEVRDAKAAVKTARGRVTSYYPDMKKLMDGLDNAQEELKEFVAGPLQHLEELKDMEAPPPEPEEEQAADDAEEAAEAPAATDEAAASAAA